MNSPLHRTRQEYRLIDVNVWELWGLSERTGLFAGDNPFDLCRVWLSAAAETEPNDPNAMSLATVDKAGLPNVRIVLLKEIEDDAFVFYTNYTSAKGQELAASESAALCLHWKSLRRQIRVRGSVSKVSPEQSDAYFETRPLESRLGAIASKQSQEIENKEQLKVEIEAVSSRYGMSPPRPDHWGGYRIRPIEIEFWADGAYRLHDRFQWRRASPLDEWRVQRLYP